MKPREWFIYEDTEDGYSHMVEPVTSKTIKWYQAKPDIIHVIEKSAYDALAAENERLKLMGTRTTYAALAEENNALRTDNAELVEAAKDALRYIEDDGRIGQGDKLKAAIAKHGGKT